MDSQDLVNSRGALSERPTHPADLLYSRRLPSSYPLIGWSSFEVDPPAE